MQDSLDSNPRNLHKFGRREPIPQRCPLSSKHTLILHTQHAFHIGAQANTQKKKGDSSDGCTSTGNVNVFDATGSYN